MTSIDISVDLGRDVDEIRERIIREAAISLLREVSPYDPGDRHFTKLGHELRAEISVAIRDEVQRAVADDLKGVIGEEREKVKAAVRGKAAEILTESVQRFVA